MTYTADDEHAHKFACAHRPDAKNAHYQQTIKQGDLLLDRLQKLAKIIDVE